MRLRPLAIVCLLLPLLVFASRKTATSKSMYGTGDMGTTGDLAATNANGAALTLHSSYEAVGVPNPSAVFYHLQFNQPLPSPLEVDVDVPFEPGGPDPDGGPSFGFAFDNAMTGELIVLVTACNGATASSQCGAGTQCACASAMLVDPTGGSSPVRFVLDSTQLPGAPTTFNTGDEIDLYLVDPSGKVPVLRPAASFITAYAAGQPLTVPAGDALTLDRDVPVPTLSSIDPPARLRGLSAVPLALTGTGFIYGASAAIDGNLRTAQFVSSTTLTTSLGPVELAGAGVRQVTAVNPTQPDGGGPSNALPFTIVVPSLSPASGPADGGTLITATGVNFSQLSAITIDGQAAGALSVGSDTQVTFVTPAHAAGPVDVVFVTDAGDCVADGGFTYAAANGGGAGGGGSAAGGGSATGGGAATGGGSSSGGGSATGGGLATGGGGGGSATGGGAAAGGSGGGSSSGCGCSTEPPGVELLLLLLLGAARQRKVPGLLRLVRRAGDVSSREPRR